MFTDVTWFSSITGIFTDIFSVVMQPPVSYFVIIGLIAMVAGIIRKFKR